MDAHRQQAHLEAPLEAVWELVATPSRYPEWWPRVIEVHGERFEQGDEFAQVTQGPFGKINTNFLLDRRDNLREIRMTCQLSGTYADWVLTEAQGGTFVELEMGIHPRRVPDRVFASVLGRSWYRRWANSSLDGLRDAVAAARAE